MQLVSTHLCLFFLHLVGVRESGPPMFSCFAYVDLLSQCAGYALDDVYGAVCKVVSGFSESIRS